MDQEQTTAETVVAVLPTAGTENDKEVQMKTEVSEIESYASRIVISNHEDYKNAAAFGKEVKRKSAQIKEFFEPIKKSAYDTHAAICKREKDMLSPLVQAEKIVKKAMGDYTLEQERKKREEEERIRKMALEESERKLREALALEESGKKEEAAQTLMDAEYMDNAANNIVVSAPNVTASGVSYTTSWEISEIDESKVPMYINGVCVRPVDKKQVLAVIKLTKGNVNIPGVKFKETKTVSIKK